jgi:glycosyltransferase involved in cell wall biosynthesis
MASTSSLTASAFAPLTLPSLSFPPLVSVLLGNYNYASYVGQAIESVLDQTYPHWELVICDDGSTDESVSLIEAYVERDQRIRLLRKPNGGHTSALNMAYSASRGTILCLLDSDDFYAPTKLARVVATFRESPGTGFLVHRIIRVNRLRERQGAWPLSDSLPEGWLAPEMLTTGGVFPYAPPTSGISLRREVAELLFPLPVTAPLHTCPDQVIVRLAPLLSETRRLPDSLAEYRLHDTNTYSKRRLTCESVQRELDLSRRLWEEQQNFLSRRYPDLKDRASSLEKSSHTALLQYLLAKLRNQPDARLFRDAYLATCRQRHWAWILLWRASLYLPLAAFRRMSNLVLGQGMLKQWIARFKSII